MTSADFSAYLHVNTEISSGKFSLLINLCPSYLLIFIYQFSNFGLMCNLIHKHKPHIRLIQNAIRIIPVRWYKFSLQADFRPAITHNALALHFYSPLTKNIRTLELFLKINTKKSTNSQKINLPLRWSFRKTFGTHTYNMR